MHGCLYTLSLQCPKWYSDRFSRFCRAHGHVQQREDRHTDHAIHAAIDHILHHDSTHDHLMALCPGLPGSAGTKRNIHPLAPLLLINHPYHLPTSTTNTFCASSLLNPRTWQSLCTTCNHVLFGVPLGLQPTISYSIHCLLYTSDAADE